MNLAELIADLYTNLLFVIKKIAKKNNISSSQLLCVYAIPSEGISQSDLAKILCLDLSTLSRNLDKLLFKKIDNKTHSSLDHRKQTVILTDKGEKLYIQILYDLNQALNMLYDFSDNSDDFDTIINSISQFNWLLCKKRYKDVSF